MDRIVILISGRGSNMRAIIEDTQHNPINAQVIAVIANQVAEGIDFARSKGIATEIVEHRAYASRELFEEALQQCIDKYQPDWIFLAGFMRILGEAFVKNYMGKMLNIHPSLLPKYTGLNTHERAIKAGESEHGASVHFVTPALDGGPVLMQIRIPILKTDNALTLSERLLKHEHYLYTRALRHIIGREVCLENGIIKDNTDNSVRYPIQLDA